MSELTRYSGSKCVLVQFRLPGMPELPPVIRMRTVDPATPRKEPASQKELLRLNGATGSHLRKTLEESGLLWVDAYYDHRQTAGGKMNTLLTFFWGRESNYSRELELIEQAFPLMANLHLQRWGEIVVREMTARDGSHTFNTIVFDRPILGENSEIDKERLRKREYEDFGLTRTWSAGNVKPRENHVAA